MTQKIRKKKNCFTPKSSVPRAVALADPHYSLYSRKTSPEQWQNAQETFLVLAYVINVNPLGNMI